MAKLLEQTFVVTVSKLARNISDHDQLLLTPEQVAEIAIVIETLAGDGIIAEIEQVK